MSNQIYKTVVVIRKDLNLPPGKAAAQVAHAIMRAQINFKKTISNFSGYTYDCEKKPICIVCTISSEKKLINLLEKVVASGVPYALQIDEGHNFVSKDTITTLCIGPGKEEKINMLTKRLRVY